MNVSRKISVQLGVMFFAFFAFTMSSIAVGNDSGNGKKRVQPQDGKIYVVPDTASLESVIKESVRDVVNQEPKHETEHLENETRLVDLTRQLADYTWALFIATVWTIKNRQ